MRKTLKYTSFSLLIVLCLTSIVSPALGAISDHMPKASDVSG